MNEGYRHAQGNSLFRRLRRAAGEDWRRYAEHDFVAALGTGTLPEACFRHYLIQDYLFLIHFARAYALAVYKSETLADMRFAARGVEAIIGSEMNLHVAFCREWGLDEAAMVATPEAPATMAYTRYVLERGMAGDVLDLYVALAPCMVGYGEIGWRLAHDPTTRLEGNPYRAWIETYAGAGYQDVVDNTVLNLDRLMAARGGENRFEALARTFRDATRLEIGFWDMGLSPLAP